MRDVGFLLFQTLLALIIVSTSLLFILEMTSRSLISHNNMIKNSNELNAQINGFEISIAKEIQ